MRLGRWWLGAGDQWRVPSHTIATWSNKRETHCESRRRNRSLTLEANLSRTLEMAAHRVKAAGHGGWSVSIDYDACSDLYLIPASAKPATGRRHVPPASLDLTPPYQRASYSRQTMIGRFNSKLSLCLCWPVSLRGSWVAASVIAQPNRLIAEPLS